MRPIRLVVPRSEAHALAYVCFELEALSAALIDAQPRVTLAAFSSVESDRLSGLRVTQPRNQSAVLCLEPSLTDVRSSQLRTLAVGVATAILVVVAIVVARPQPVASIADKGTRLSPKLDSLLSRDFDPTKGLVLVIADPNCPHCHTLIGNLSGIWRPDVHSGWQLGVLYVGRLPTENELGKVRDPLPLGSITAVDSARVSMASLRIQYFPVTLILDSDRAVVHSMVGAVSPDSLRFLLTSLL